MTEKETAFQKRLRENPDLYDDMDCRPGPPNVSQKYIDSITPDYLKKPLAEPPSLRDEPED